MIREIPDSTDDTFWWIELEKLFDSYEEEESQTKARGSSSSAQYCSLSDLEDLQEFGISAWGNTDKGSYIKEDISSAISDSLLLEIKEAVMGLPSENAFKKLFWELLEFEQVDLPVSRSLAEHTPEDFDIPAIKAESDALKVIATTLYGDDVLSGYRDAVSSLAAQTAREYDTTLLVIGSSNQKGHALLVLCSREASPRIYPVYDRDSTDEISRILLGTAHQVTDLGGLAAFTYLEKAFSEEQRSNHFRKWVNQQRKASDWWIWHQYSKTKVLSPEKQIELLKKLSELWPQDIRNTSLLPTEATARRLYDILFIRNMRLAAWIAHKYRWRIGRGCDFEDLYQEGLYGLMQAIKRFDPFYGTQFSTYAVWWVRQAILRAIDNYERTVRVPVHMVERINRIARAAAQIRLEEGREPSIWEISERLWMPVEKVLHGLEAATQIVSIDALVAHGETHPWMESMEHDGPTSAFDQVSRNDLRVAVNEALASLTPREEKVLRMRFGIGVTSTYTLEEVGQDFGVTRERIRQIENKALCRLTHPSRSRKLQVFSNSNGNGREKALH